MRDEVQTCRNQIAQLNALIIEVEAFDNPGEVFNTLMRLKDDVRVEDAMLIGFNDLIAQAEEEIEIKEAHAEYSKIPAYLVFHAHFVYMGPFFILDKLSEVVESLLLVDKMKYVFGRSRGEDELLAGFMRDLCVSLRISLSQKHRLVTELEAVVEVEGAVKCLEHMRVIVARDAVTLGELETLLGRAQVGASLKRYDVAGRIYIFTLSLNLLTMVALYILDKLGEVADSSCLQDKMKVVFIQARGADESFIALMRGLCSALRVSITKNRRLIAELEALGQQAETFKPLDFMREIVGRDVSTLGVLEQLLAGSNDGMRLKASYVAEMEETD
ncbi:hypothetical protein Tco_1501289 [Tanacetum coccineum]